MKQIIETDIQKIKEILNLVVNTDQYVSLTRMGGLTNRTYLVKLINGGEYVVRIPGDGTEKMIVRADEKISTELAYGLGIDTDLLYFGVEGIKVSKCIPNAITMSAGTIKESGRIEKIAKVLNVLHNCGEDTKVPFEVFDMADSYETIIAEKNVEMYPDYAETKATVMKIKEEVDTSVLIKKVPCHNDPLCENWVEGDGKMYLIDWEYAGMNDGMWDLAAVSIEASFSQEDDNLLLQAYLGKAPNEIEHKHFLANKIYVDYLWTLWAKARVPYDGQPMEDWATERYTRLKHFIEEYNRI